jgi:hypothetical protein
MQLSKSIQKYISTLNISDVTTIRLGLYHDIKHYTLTICTMQGCYIHKIFEEKKGINFSTN